MRAHHFHPSLFLSALLLSGLAVAQTAASPTAAPAAADPPLEAIGGTDSGSSTNQRIERIHVEDEGSSVRELRVGGQTESISVQPKVGNAPGYSVRPNASGKRPPTTRDGSESSGSSNGPRTWDMLKF